MTRAETIATAADLWQEVLGSATWGDPIGIDQTLSAVANDLARRKKVWFDFRRVDVVGSQEVYSLVNTFDLRGVGLLQSTGFYVPVQTYSVVQAQRAGLVYSGLAAGSPSFAVDAGQTLYLCPASVSDAVGGLELLGFHNPGTLNNCLWPNDTDENPLPEWCHDAVALGLAARRAALYVGSQDMRDRAAVLERRFEAEARSLEGEGHRQYSRVMGIGLRRTFGY